MKIKIINVQEEGGVERYNNFVNENIIVSDRFFENGIVYLSYKPKTELGGDVMDEIEQIDRMVVIAQKDIMTSKIDIELSETELADIEKQIEKKPDAKELKSLEESKGNFERQIKMSLFTIEQKQREIACLKQMHTGILNNI